MNHTRTSLLTSTVFASLASLNSTSHSAEAVYAHNFKLPSLTTKQSVELLDYKGKIIYLDFWASWCKPCIKSLPELNRLRNELKKSANFEVIAVNLDDNIQDAKEFIAKHPVNYPVLIDSDGKVARKYGVSVMPSSYLIDQNGEIAAIYRGYKDNDILKIKNAVNQLSRKQ